jgi:nucleotide-binding universal stress UspA family protein
MNAPQPHVTLGVSRTQAERGGAAIGWAVDEAAARHVGLRLVHAQEWPYKVSPHADPDDPAYVWSTHLRASGEAVLEDARRIAEARQPTVPVSTELVAGRPVQVLRKESGDAEMLVLGTRRFGGLEGTFAGGGKGETLTGHVSCPLALVPHPVAASAADAPVVVGADGSAASEAAIDLAFEEAAAAKAEVVAVWVRRPRDPAVPEFIDTSAFEQEPSPLFAGRQARFPGTHARYEVLTGQPGQMLAAAAQYARCLVVGSRGRGGFKGLLIGSTARSLVHQTRCPLVVAPPPKTV